MSKSEYDYGVDAELDEGFYPPVPSRPPLTGTKIWNEYEAVMKERHRDMVRRQEEAREGELFARFKSKLKEKTLDAFLGTCIFQWTLSLPGGNSVQGKIAIPEEISHQSDRVLMTTFDKLFPSVSVKPLGGPRFQALFEGRNLGKFEIEVPREMAMDIFGRANYLAPLTEGGFAAKERDAMKWLRNNLELKLDDLGERHPPYVPKVPKSKPKSKVHIGTDAWIGREKEPESPWRPVNEGAQDMAKSGVNLSMADMRGVTNMALFTWAQDTSRAGTHVEQMGNSGVIVRMHEEGKIIG